MIKLLLVKFLLMFFPKVDLLNLLLPKHKFQRTEAVSISREDGGYEIRDRYYNTNYEPVYTVVYQGSVRELPEEKVEKRKLHINEINELRI